MLDAPTLHGPPLCSRLRHGAKQGWGGGQGVVAVEAGELGCSAPAGRPCGKFLPEESCSNGPLGPWVHGLVFLLLPQMEKGLWGRACLAPAAQA